MSNDKKLVHKKSLYVQIKKRHMPKVNRSESRSDYQPVLLPPVLTKKNEKIILSQVTTFTEKKILYHKCQSSHQKHHLTLTICLKLKDDIEKAIE